MSYSWGTCSRAPVLIVLAAGNAGFPENSPPHHLERFGLLKEITSVADLAYQFLGEAVVRDVKRPEEPLDISNDFCVELV